MRSMVRGAVLVVSLSLTLVLLPIAINVGTGGTAPAFLQPYVGWVWPAIGVLWALVIVTGLLEVRNRRRPRVAAASADQPRNRRNALARVDRYLSERQAGSLAQRTRVALALDGQPDAVRPFDLLVQPLNSAPRRIPDDAGIATVFDELEDSMLILGAPGAGKTTLLLNLAQNLAAQARTDEQAPIPVVVDLAGWIAQPSHRDDDHPSDNPLVAGFVRWLLSELSDHYRIPPAIGRAWLRHGRLALLLDGLDEVEESSRAKLEPVLQGLRSNYQIGQLAVTCRTQDYERLPGRLSLYGAVHIRPLTRRQVLEYFAAVGPALDGARAAIEQDEELWELVNSPLMLNVMMLAYQGRAPEDVTAGGVADLRRDLFDTFVCEVLSRNRKAGRQYDARTALRRLWCLAWWTRSRAGDRRAVPRWLPPDSWYGLSLPEVDYLAHAVCLPALFAALTAGATLLMIAQYGVLAGLAVAGSALVLVHVQPRPWQRVSGNAPRQLLIGGLLGMTGAAVTIAVTGAALGLVELLTPKLAIAVEAALVAGAYVIELLVFHDNMRRLLLGVRLTVVVAASWVVLTMGEPLPFACGVAIGLLVAQGIRMVKALPTDHLAAAEAGDAWRVDAWVAAGAVAALLIALLLGADLRSPQLEAVAGIVIAVVAAKAWRRRPPVLAGPLSRWLHDLLLRWTGYLSWNRRAFLQYAADRYVLARTGHSEYAFIHLLIRDHLAECTPDVLAAKVERRIAEREGRVQVGSSSR
jgi:hypothetical protein